MAILTIVFMILSIVVSGICVLTHNYDAANYYISLGILLYLAFAGFEFDEDDKDEEDEEQFTYNL